MKEYRVILLIPIVIFSTLALCWYRNQLSITPFQSTDSIVLPANVKQRLLTDDQCEFMFVRYDGKRIQYYYKSFNPYRKEIVLGALKQLHVSLIHTLPSGDYLFFLHDGSHQDEGVPILALAGVDSLVAKRKIILIPDTDALSLVFYPRVFKVVDRNLRRHTWKNKQAKIFWRGSLTGVGSENYDLYAPVPRLQFMHYIKNLDFVDASITGTHQLNKQFKELIQKTFPSKNPVGIGDSLAYKYLIDMDGNSCSFSRMAWILYSNSVLFKHKSDKIQWYYHQLQPYVHYIPVTENFSDLQEQFAWAEAHPKQAETIALNGRKLAKKIFSRNSVLTALETAMREYNTLYAEYISSYMHNPY